MWFERVASKIFKEPEPTSTPDCAGRNMLRIFQRFPKCSAQCLASEVDSFAGATLHGLVKEKDNHQVMALQAPAPWQNCATAAEPMPSVQISYKVISRMPLGSSAYRVLAMFLWPCMALALL